MLSFAELQESAKTPMYAVRHAPRGKGGRNWITADKPGNRGQLPAYIQNVRRGIMRSGRDIGSATAIALSRIRAWAAGLGNVSPEVKAASIKALAQFAAMRGRASARRARGATRQMSETDTQLLEYAVGCAIEALETRPWASTSRRSDGAQASRRTVREAAGGKLFGMGNATYDVAKMHTAAAGKPVVDIDPRQFAHAFGEVRIDPTYAMKTDLSKPVLLAAAPSGGVRLVDGYHRAYRALHEKQALRGRVLSTHEFDECRV